MYSLVFFWLVVPPVLGVVFSTICLNRTKDHLKEDAT
jgi:hypothetical protein